MVAAVTMPVAVTTSAVATIAVAAIRAAEEIRKPEIIDQRGTKHAGEAQQALVDPGHLANPLRWIRCEVTSTW